MGQAQRGHSREPLERLLRLLTSAVESSTHTGASVSKSDNTKTPLQPKTFQAFPFRNTGLLPPRPPPFWPGDFKPKRTRIGQAR